MTERDKQKAVQRALTAGLPYYVSILRNGSMVFYNREYEAICVSEKQYGPAHAVPADFKSEDELASLYLYTDVDSPQFCQSTKARLQRLVKYWNDSNKKAGLPEIRIKPCQRALGNLEAAP